MRTVIDCIVQSHFHQRYCLQPTQPMFMPKRLYNLFNGVVVPLHLTISLRMEKPMRKLFYNLRFSTVPSRKLR